MFDNLRREWDRMRLSDPAYDFLFEDPTDGKEVVSFDCETTGLDPYTDDIISIGAVMVRGHRVLTSQSLKLPVRPEIAMDIASIKAHGMRERDVRRGLPPRQAVQRFVDFVGGRPLVGYYLEFDVKMVNSYLRPWLGINLPNPQIDVSALYYEKKVQALRRPGQPEPTVDLRFQSMLTELGIPEMPVHDALNDAVMTALMYLKLTRAKG